MAQISLGFLEASLATNPVIAKDDLALLTLRPPFLSVAFPGAYHHTQLTQVSEMGPGASRVLDKHSTEPHPQPQTVPLTEDRAETPSNDITSDIASKGREAPVHLSFHHLEMTISSFLCIYTQI